MTTQINQYLNKDILLKTIPSIDVLPDHLGSTDTYHEEKILKKYMSLSKDAQDLLYKSAIQMCVIGYGNKNYGFIRLNEKETITLIDLFKKYGIKYFEKQNSKYSDDELSARRLMRLFRYQVQKFIIEHKKPSFLWNKYANKTNLNMVGICFPGGEHLLETKEQAEFMLETYSNLDKQLNTKFKDRLMRVFVARRILQPDHQMNM
jgi:hypothetical protein